MTELAPSPSSPSERLLAANIVAAGFLHAALWGAYGMVFSSTGGAGNLPLSLLSSLLIALTLAFLVRRLSGPRLHVASALWAFWFVIAHLNTLVEAFVFHLAIPPDEGVRLVGASVVITAALTPLFVFRFLPSMASTADRQFLLPASGGSWAWRVAIGILTYIVLYMTAGIMIYPYVQYFYETKALPSQGNLLLLQVFRGLLYVLIAIPVAKRATSGRWTLAAMLGACYSVLGGIAPLMVPSPYFPDDVRMVHLGEVGVSNFLFGFLLGLILTRTPEPAAGRSTGA